jgi:hypothetical protein
MTEGEIEVFTDKFIKAINKVLPKGKKFEDLTAAEKSEFFSSYIWTGDRWVEKGLAAKVKRAMSNTGKSALVGMTMPDKLIPGLKDPKTKTAKAASMITRGAVLAAPGGMAIGALLGAMFGAKQPDEVDKNYSAAKKTITDKLKSLIPKKKK